MAYQLREGPQMVNHCANPKCCKPLHYLREGKVYVFDVTSVTPKNGERIARRMEHFWLCGACNETYLLEQSPDRTVRIAPRSERAPTPAASPLRRPIAS